MTITTKTPAHRVLFASRLDPEDDPQPLLDEGLVDGELLDAIHGGKQLRCASNHDDMNVLEVCMTEFRDPATDEIRYAVEMWNDAAGYEQAKHDFATHEDASARYHYYYEELDLETHATAAAAA
jgi:hypothetical protein